MKVNVLLLRTAGALFAGAVTYGIYKYCQNQNPDSTAGNTAQEKQKNDAVASDVEKVHSDTEEIILSEFEKRQSEALNSIKERHSATAQYMRETLEKIGNDNEDFDKTIDQVNDDLDDLLK